MPASKSAVRRPLTAAPEGSELKSERAGAVRILTLARPEKRNSLSEAMLGALAAAIAAADGDDSVRAVVLAAEGPVFSAGHDLKELTARRRDADGGRAYHAEIMRRCSDMMRAIVRCRKPFIAAVQGPALAAGCQLVATCDLAVAASHATFATPGVNIGLFCSTPMVALARNVPRKRAMEMLLLGEQLAADKAAEYGLVNRVVPAERVRADALALAELIAAKPKATVAIGKEAFYRQLEMELDEAYIYAAGVMVENMLHAEAKEGIGAFLEKRQPDWEQS
jgi:enoyl-CoA hydratase/carnithine racemase